MLFSFLGCDRDVIVNKQPPSDFDKANIAIVKDLLERYDAAGKSPNRYLRKGSATLAAVIRRNGLWKADRITSRKHKKNSGGISWPNGQIIIRADLFSAGINRLAYILVHELAHVDGADEPEAIEAENALFDLTHLSR